MAKMNHILTVDSVILEFGSKRILQDIFLKCETNRITGLMGRNGVGKTCLMNIMFGKLRPLNGTVRLDNNNLNSIRQKSFHLKYLPQFSFIPKHLKLSKIFKDFKLIFSNFEWCFPDLKKHYHQRIGHLSGGERRIIEIYLILTSDSKFCLLDEPFSHVMPLHVETIKSLIRKEKPNKGILITDHMYEHLIELSDEVYLIRDGRTHLVKDVDEIELLGYAKLPPQ